MLTGRKLLLADDSVTIQKVVDLTFGDEGMRVVTVSDGEQAIARLEELEPDIVLADVHMPKLSGYQVCEQIKRDERFRHIPVMLLVGSFEPFDEEEARRVGADAHLTKPFQSIKQLVNKVGSLLGGGSPSEEEEANTQRLPALEETQPHQDDARADEETSAQAMDVATADTAPLPPEPPHAEQESEDGDAPSTSPAVSSAKLDQRATPVYWDGEETLPADTPLANLAQKEPQPFSMEESTERAYAQAAGGAQVKNAAGADDPLLDLGEMESSYSNIAEDDFILDLQEEFYRRPTAMAAPVEELSPPAKSADEATSVHLGEELAEAEPKGREFVEAQLAVEEQRAGFAATETQEEEKQAVEESSQISAAPDILERGASLEPLALTSSTSAAAKATSTGSIAAPEDEEEASAARGALAHAGQIGLDQLSPEVIDAIARRAVEHLSERVVQEIAWEVVPQLAELLIKRRLEEERAEAK